MLETLSFTLPVMPRNKPRYLMGVGTPDDLLESVARGIDMFDCVMPTRSGRHGQAFTWDGPINIKNAKYVDDADPLDETSTCPASCDYSKAYLNHLFRAGEYLAATLLTWHNLAFYQELMARMRSAIEANNFDKWAEEFRRRYDGDDS